MSFFIFYEGEVVGSEARSALRDCFSDGCKERCGATARPSISPISDELEADSRLQIASQHHITGWPDAPESVAGPPRNTQNTRLGRANDKLVARVEALTSTMQMMVAGAPADAV